MATTAAMVLNAPKGKVSFRNLIVNVQNNTFSIEYAILEGRKRKFIYEKVNGVITQNFRDWLTKGFFVKDESGSTTANRTSKFKLHLDRKNARQEPQRAAIIPHSGRFVNRQNRQKMSGIFIQNPT